MSDLRERLMIRPEHLEIINDFIMDKNNKLVNDLIKLVEKYGGPEEINRKAGDARSLKNLLSRMKEQNSTYLADLDWLIEQRDRGAFIKLAHYRKNLLGKNADTIHFNEENAVTLEISSLHFFPWLIAEARQAIEKRQLMPGRFIRVRCMKEQAEDNCDILAVAAAMQVLGASCVETLDTRGTDGSNVHLGGPDTITGYFGGIGQPNDYPLKWVDEYLYYYTNYGIRQVLNVNPGTVILAYMIHKLGIDNEFKISVFMGNDNPYAVLWTLIGARLFSREDGTTSLNGFNFSNSVKNDTILAGSRVREAMGFTRTVRFEHHVTETYRSIVRQPYNRRRELVDLAKEVPNISAKHEGGDPETDSAREHPSNILDYFLTKEEILNKGLMEALEQNYLDKHNALMKTADALTRAGIGVIPAGSIHF
jgi:hypothetical protein